MVRLWTPKLVVLGCKRVFNQEKKLFSKNKLVICITAKKLGDVHRVDVVR